jgi:hypothetical protein
MIDSLQWWSWIRKKNKFCHCFSLQKPRNYAMGIKEGFFFIWINRTWYDKWVIICFFKWLKRFICSLEVYTTCKKLYCKVMSVNYYMRNYDRDIDSLRSKMKSIEKFRFRSNINIIFIPKYKILFNFFIHFYKIFFKFLRALIIYLPTYP